MEQPIELRNTLTALLDRLEGVFHEDWAFTQAQLQDRAMLHHVIAPSGTFLKPGVDDEENNWANRARLLQAYREAKAFITDGA